MSVTTVLRLLRGWPFTVWFLVAVVLSVLVSSLWTEYDDGSFAALLFMTSGVWAFPLWVWTENGVEGPVAVVLAGTTCLLLDLVLSRGLRFLVRSIQKTYAFLDR